MRSLPQWTPYDGTTTNAATNKRYIQIKLAHHSCIVRLVPMAVSPHKDKFLWVVNNRYGYGATLEQAKVMAETQLLLELSHERD